jgi:hypothetical protein
MGDIMQNPGDETPSDDEHQNREGRELRERDD